MQPRHLGQRAKIKLRHAYEGRRNFEGTLVAVEGDDVVLRVDDEEYLLPLEWIRVSTPETAEADNGKKKG